MGCLNNKLLDFLALIPLSFQVAVSALQNLPVVNAVIDGDDIIYRDYIDISVAVGTSKVWTPLFVFVECSSYVLFYIWV